METDCKPNSHFPVFIWVSSSYPFSLSLSLAPENTNRNYSVHRKNRRCKTWHTHYNFGSVARFKCAWLGFRIRICWSFRALWCYAVCKCNRCVADMCCGCLNNMLVRFNKSSTTITRIVNACQIQSPFSWRKTLHMAFFYLFIILFSFHIRNLWKLNIQ